MYITYIQAIVFLRWNSANKNKHHRPFSGATSNARLDIVGTDIARPDKSPPYRKGGHRETCFSVRV